MTKKMATRRDELVALRLLHDGQVGETGEILIAKVDLAVDDVVNDVEDSDNLDRIK